MKMGEEQDSNNLPEENSKKKSKNKLHISLVLLIFVIMSLFIFHLLGNQSKAEADTSATGITFDENIEEGGWNNGSKDEVQAALNKKVEEGMINISINTDPVFKNGQAKGNLWIVNEQINRYPQVVEIIRNDNHKSIYKSGAIPVGSKIESAQLSTDLPKGKYECTAYFYNVDAETGNYLGKAGAIINLTVEE